MLNMHAEFKGLFSYLTIIIVDPKTIICDSFQHQYVIINSISCAFLDFHQYFVARHVFLSYTLTLLKIVLLNR